MVLLTAAGCAHPEPSKQVLADDPTLPYFERVNRIVGKHWDPRTPMQQRDPTGAIYGGRDRYTLLSITLDGQGMLREAHVVKTSGVEFLDETAIVAFQESQPFPHPPPDLLGEDNLLRFECGFRLEFGYFLTHGGERWVREPPRVLRRLDYMSPATTAGVL